MQKVKYLFVIAFLSFGIWSCQDTHMEEEVFEEKERFGSARMGFNLRVNAYGMLEIPSEDAYEEYYSQLEKAMDDPENQYTEKEAYDCVKEYKALDDFEKSTGIYSLRAKYLNIECAELERGIYKLENLTFNPIPDDILATLLNQYGEVMIGRKIYVFKTMSLYMSTDKENLEEVIHLRTAGKESKVDFTKFTFHGDARPTRPGLGEGGPRSSCVSNFSVNANRPTKSVTVVWNGSTGNNHIVTYNWGDGKSDTYSSLSASQSHVYDNHGVYTITATVADTSSASACTASSTAGADVSEDCGVTFEAHAGTNGFYTFVPNPLTSSNGAIPTSWNWAFGDGQSQVVNGAAGTVTHQYACEKQYQVTLEVVTSSSSCTPRGTRSVNVEGIDCVDDNYKSDWSRAYYNGYDNSILHRTWVGGFLANKKRVKAKMKNFKKRNNGTWKKDCQHLGVQFGGTVFTEGGNGCNAGNARNLTNWHQKRRKVMQVHEKIYNKVHVDQNSPYWVKYYVDQGSGSVLITIKYTDDADCN